MGGRYGDVDTGPQDLRRNTPANTVKNSTYSTSNRFSGPQSGRTAVSTGGFGQGVGQVSRPALAAAAVANQGPPSGRGAVSTGGFGEGYGQIQRPSVPAGPPSGRTAVSTGGFGEGYGQVSQPSGPPSGRDAMSTGGFGEGYGGGDPYAGLDLTSRANSNARMVLPSADEQRAAIAAGGTAYNPGQTARIDQIQDNRVMEWLGTEGAQNLLASNATAAAPAAPAPVAAWDPANNDPAMTDPVGMWTDPLSGGQMPDPADADAWQAMQDAVDSEFGPGQDIYNPTYDVERFPTYDPSNTGGGWGGPDTGGTWDDGYGGVGDGPGADMGTFNPNSGEYLQFGLNLAQNTSDYNRVGEGREFWNQAQDRKWDEMRRGIPGQYNSRGMIDSGLLTRAEGLTAGDQQFETDVRQWSDNEERARLERERVNLYGGFEGGLTQGLMDNYMSGMLTYDDSLTAMDEAMGSGTGGYMRSGIMDRAIPTWGSGVGR